MAIEKKYLKLNFNLFNTLILLGTIQGFIFAGVVLFFKKYRSKSSYFMVALITVVTLNSLQYYLKDIGYVSYWTLMGTFYVPYATLNCTLLYLYTKTLLIPEYRIPLKDKLLFLPFLFFFFTTAFYKIILYRNPLSKTIEHSYAKFANYHEIFAVFYSLILVALSYKIVLDYQKNSRNYNLSIVRQQVIWLKVTLILLFFVVFIYAYLTVKETLHPEVQVNFYALWISNSFMIYWLGHIGIYKYGVQQERQNIRKYSLENRVDVVVDKTKNSIINSLEKLIIKDKRFLDSQISLETIASELEVSKGHLSRLIHSELNTSFTDYINLLRIDEAKSHLINPSFSNYTLAAIGLEAGFNSKSTFYSTFKKITGLTPLQFKNSLSSLK